MPMTVRPSRPRPPGGDDRLERARAYLARIPGAVSGQGGHDRTFRAALHVGPGFALSQEECFDLLWHEYNPRCDPPWSERELRHKVESVYKGRLVGSMWGGKLGRSSSPLGRLSSPPSRGRSLGWPSSRPHPGPAPDQVTLRAGVPVFVVPSSMSAAINEASGGRAAAVTRTQCEAMARTLRYAPMVFVADGGHLPTDFARRVTLPSTDLRGWLEEVLDEAELERLAPRIDPAADPAEWRGLWGFVALLEEERGRTPAEAAWRATARVVAVYGVARDEFGGVFPPPPPVPRRVPWGWAEDGHHPAGDSGEDLVADPMAVRSFLETVTDGWFELRCLECGPSRATFVGAYPRSDIEVAVADLVALDSDPETRPAGAYVTMNPIKPRRRMARLERNAKATKDGEIERRRWIVLDFDPIRPGGVPSSEEELDLARRAAGIVGEELSVRGAGWPSLRVLSGNGAHLWYPIDRPNDEETATFVRRFLSRAAALNPFADRVKVDQALANPSRIIRIAGTANRKGTATMKRPWRMATLSAEW